MSATPTTEETPAPVASSASSHKAPTIKSEQTEISHDARRELDEGSFKHMPDSHLHPNYPHYPPAVYSVGMAPSRSSRHYPTPESSIHSHVSSESSIHETPTWRYGTAADWVRCVNGSSGRTAHMKGIVCVVLAVVLILIVVLVLSLLPKKGQ
ncbi:hypothetical protein HD806DRAFT_297814 [Xylariaceae sp. AK1471]|nr:hypothetical protein HD806DRAFT_297814 [Xylariaceae sp. AK1471]